MHFPSRYFVFLPLTAAISLLTVSCSESKISQCHKIIDVANKAVNQAKSVANVDQSKDPKAMLKAADVIEKASQEMKAIDIKDPKLRDYQAGFVKMYRDTSKSTRDFVAAFEKKDRLAAEAAVTRLQQATTPERQIVDALNAYCDPKPQKSN